MFPEDDLVAIENSTPGTETLESSTQYFYNQGGAQQGPVTFERLKELAATGIIAGSDLVWYEGAAQWTPAHRLPGLEFISASDRTRSWFSRNKALSSVIAALLLIVVCVPIYYVIAESNSFVRELQEKKDRILAEIEAEKDRQLELELANKELEIKIREIEIFAAEDREAKRKHDEWVLEQEKNRRAQRESTDRIIAKQEELAALERAENRRNADLISDSNRDIAAAERERARASEATADAIDRNTDERRKLREEITR